MIDNVFGAGHGRNRPAESEICHVWVPRPHVMCCVSAVASGTTVWGRVAGVGPFSLSSVPGALNVAIGLANRTQLGSHNYKPPTLKHICLKLGD